MALPHSTIPSLLTLNGFLEDRRDTYITVLGLYPSGGGIGSSRVFNGPFLPLRLQGRRRKVVCSGRLKVMEAQLVENGQVRGGVEIPISCYQVCEEKSSSYHLMFFFFFWICLLWCVFLS